MKHGNSHHGSPANFNEFHKLGYAVMWYFDTKLAYHSSGMDGGDGP